LTRDVKKVFQKKIRVQVPSFSAYLDSYNLEVAEIERNHKLKKAKITKEKRSYVNPEE
jgi:hypothetical protein